MANSNEKQTPTDETAQDNASASPQEEKFSTATWALLFTATAVIDLAQIGIDAIGIGFFVNWLVDIFVGLSLVTFFLINNMLDWRLATSLLMAFGLGELTGGAMPAWVMDIGYAWLITDGSRTMGNVPIVGEKAAQIARTALQKGDSGNAIAVLSSNEQAMAEKLQAVSVKARTGAERVNTAVKSGEKSVDGIKPVEKNLV